MTGAARPLRTAATVAVVPVKRLAEAKQRLAPVLAPEQRRRLVLTMLADVLRAASAAKGIARVLVVSRDADVARVAHEHKATCVVEPEGSDLNAAISFGLQEAASSGAMSALVLPADVPFITPAAIDALLGLARKLHTGLAIVGSRDGGTNALLLPLPAPFGPAFGPNSYIRHLTLARESEMIMAINHGSPIGFDIDTADDLAHLDGEPRYRFLKEKPAMVSRLNGSTDGSSSNDGRLSEAQALALCDAPDLSALLARAEAKTVAQHGTLVSFSKKVFIPLTKLCRDVCHYCTFAHAPRELPAPYLSPEEVLAIARAGQKAGCKEALFTLGDKPELRYTAAQEALDKLGYKTTLDYLAAMAALVLKETGLLPHLNPGIMTEDEMRRLREVSVSMGIMLETASPRLSEKGGPHHGSPDKVPAVRLATLEAAGRAAVPFTSGILIGIGETRRERIEALLAIRDIHERHGHIQEVIIQNFRAKPDTKMANAPEPTLEDHLWTIAAARLIFGPEMNIQAPPNLQPEALSQLVRAGINDWGGVSPVTPDHVNPDAPWPHLDRLAEATDAAGRTLVERTAAYPAYALAPERWIAKPLKTPLLRSIDTQGYAREHDWAPGDGTFAPPARDIALVHKLPRRLKPEPTSGAIAEPSTEREQNVDATLGERSSIHEARSGSALASPSPWRGGVRGGGIVLAPSSKHEHEPAIQQLGPLTFEQDHSPHPRPLPVEGRGEVHAMEARGTIDASARAADNLNRTDVGSSRNLAWASRVAAILDRVAAGRVPNETEIVALFEARGDDFAAVCAVADDLRAKRNGDDVTYVVNRNINYTNMCTYGCKFCAFSKGRLSTQHRDKPYDLELEEIANRTREAWERGATEVCLQGGIGPRYTGQTYFNIVEAVKIGAPDIHVHAFSPLEVWTGATTTKQSLTDYLARLKDAGLSSLPGTAAEILDDEVRQILCPDKINTAQWFEVMEAAHTVGLKSTATIMFGHVDHYRHWARHLLRIRAQQEKTGGFTELVPLAFVHMESPIYLRGQARKGPSFRESVLMHAIGRLVLDPLITNIQASWVKLGPDGAAACLAAGANDVGGTLMNESITRAAGAAHGQEMTPIALERMIRNAGRQPRQRTTFYGAVPEERLSTAFADCEVNPMGMLAAQ